MNTEEFKKNLDAMGITYSLRIGKIFLTCPFSSHIGLQEGRHADFIIGETTGFGECGACGRKANFEEVIVAWKGKLKIPPIKNIQDKTNKLKTITIKEYLTRKGIAFRESNGELIVRCIFSNCDADRRDDKFHLYFSAETSQYNCKKCGVRGNIVTLAKFLGDSIDNITLNLDKTKVRKGYRNPSFNIVLVEQCHKGLPERIRAYLNKRGIPDETINNNKLGWGNFYGEWWITIPIKDQDGNYVFFKLRQDPDIGKEKMMYPKGNVQLYDWGVLQAENKILVICEGEMDRLLLVSKGVPAITSTHGAGTFKEDWGQRIGGDRKIYVCYDNDDPGRAGAKRVARIVQTAGNETHIVTLPDEVGVGGDITNYFGDLNGNVDDLFGKYAKRYTEIEQEERVRKYAKPKSELNFGEWKKVITDNFSELFLAAEFGASIMAQILIKDITNPFALVLVDVPSAGKTIAINFFAEIDGLTYASDKFTPASFVSNATNVKKEDLAEIDLLPKLKYKMFLIRDLATLFSKQDDMLNECLGTLTRVLDGEGFATDTGVHGQRQYVGEYLFMILAGSTPIPPRVWKMMGNLGSRLFFLSMHSRDKSDDELANQLTTRTHKEKEKTCRTATKYFLQTLWFKHPNGVVWDKTAEIKTHILTIGRCARILAKMRGVINVWKEKGPFFEGEELYDHTVPVIEKPDRINQLLYNLCCGHALVCGRTQINEDDLRLAVELAVESAPMNRARLLKKLLENGGVLETGEIQVALNCSTPTALREMETMSILGVGYISTAITNSAGRPEKTLHLAKEFEWFLSGECWKIRGITNPLKKEDTDTNLFN